MNRVGMVAACVAIVMVVIACAWAEGVKKVSKQEALDAAITKVQPGYPPMAKQLNIEGIVELEAVISDTGAVDSVNILSGNPVLTRPSVEALKKWKFKPFQADGKAVSAVAPFQFAFKKQT